MDKTYVFSNEPSSGCCGGSKLDITALLPNLIGGTRPLMEYAGKQATVEDFVGVGIYEIHYNRYTNQLYIVNGGFRPGTATTPAA